MNDRLSHYTVQATCPMHTLSDRAVRALYFTTAKFHDRPRGETVSPSRCVLFSGSGGENLIPPDACSREEKRRRERGYRESPEKPPSAMCHPLRRKTYSLKSQKLSIQNW